MQHLSKRRVLATALFAMALMIFAGSGLLLGEMSATAASSVSSEEGSMPEWASGVIRGELDGEAFTVYVMLQDFGDEIISGATWQDGRAFNFVNIDLLGQRTDRFVDRNGAVTIEIELDGNFEQRPVTDERNTPFKVTYWESLTNGYVMDGGSVVVQEVELVDGDILRLKGTFAGTVVGRAGDTKELVNGTFDVPYVVREPL